MISIERVLSRRFVMVAIGLITILAFLHQWWARTFFLDIQRQQLAQEAQALKVHLSLNMANSTSPGLVLPNHSGHIYIVSSANSRWSTAPELSAILPVESWLSTAGYFDAETEDERQFLGLTVVVEPDTRIIVLQELTGVLGQLSKSHSYMAAIALCSVFILLVLQRRLIRGAFSHLDRLTVEVESLKRGERPRLDSPHVVETAPLAEAINRLLGYLENRAERSRHSVGDLSHAMKTPLAVIRQLAERSDSGLSGEDRNQLVLQADRLTMIIEQELRRARIAGPGCKPALFSVSSVVSDLLLTVSLIYPNKPVRFREQIDLNSIFPGDQSDFTELIGNLIDNAGKWCRTEVIVSISTTPEVFSIAVEDDGPGSHLSDPSELLHRGRRLDESVEGHGLGLNIVAAIVQQYEGSIKLGRSAALGGFAVKIEIPLG